jgi:T5SS/PEP-CTERM-associated repeat protein/autotransporter-associated beta strand protein
MGDGVIYRRAMHIYESEGIINTISGIYFAEDDLNDHWFSVFDEQIFLRSTETAERSNFAEGADYERAYFFFTTLISGAVSGTDNWVHFTYQESGSPVQYVWAQFRLDTDAYPVCITYAYSTQGDFSLNSALAAVEEGPINYWKGGTGSWTNSTNWTLGVPDTTTPAGFNAGGMAEVETTATVGVLKIGVTSDGSGHLKIMSGGDFTADEILVGRSGSGTVEVTDEGKITAGNVSLGTDAGAAGSVSVTDQGTLQATTLHVGQSGTGSIQLARSGTLLTEGAVHVGESPTGVGHITVSSPDAIWRAVSGGHTPAPQVLIGDAGTGTVTVGYRSSFISEIDVILGNQAGSSHGELTIAGPLAYAGFQSRLVVGNHGYGRLSIREGAHVAASGPALSFVIGAAAGSTGEVWVSGPGSTLTVNHSVTIGQFGTGTLTLENGGGLTTPQVFLAQGNESGILNFGNANLATPSTAGFIHAESIGFLERSGNHPTVNFNQTDHFTLSAVLWSGETGEIHQRGSGTTRLTGNSRDFHGTTTVSQGVLIVDGALFGNLHVEEEATLAGSGVVENVHLTNFANLKPGDGEDGVGLLTIEGRLAPAEFARIEFNLNGRGEGEYSRIFVGNWDLVNGAENPFLRSPSPSAPATPRNMGIPSRFSPAPRMRGSSQSSATRTFRRDFSGIRASSRRWG